MKLSKKCASLFALSALSCAAFSTYAAHQDEHIVVAPNCLLKDTSFNHVTMATNDKLTLIKTDFKGIKYLIGIKKQQHHQCGGFMDVSQAWEDANAKRLKATHNADAFLASFHQGSSTNNNTLSKQGYKVRYQSAVNQLLTNMNPQNMWADLTKLTTYKDRYANSDNGVAAAAWIKSQVETIAAKAGHTDDVTAYYVKTGSRYDQPSVVVKFGKSNAPGVVIGGHMDTLPWGRMPGADDDGSGSVTVMETARVLLNSGMHFNKPIYFVWYSAEEMGLVGSQYVVRDFKAKNIPVDAVVQFDMTGYRHRGDKTMWLMDDYVNKGLTSFTETLINTYVKAPVKHSRCGYACSDHASWTKGGFKSVMPFEASMNSDNPDIHSSRDVMDNLSLDHMSNYAKLAIAFATELAEPKA